MKKEEFCFKSSDGKTSIHAVKWIPEGEVKAILQISHGMVEYIERYEEFAAHLAVRGILTAGHDHLGHGHSIGSEEDFGYFADEQGNTKLLRDINEMRKGLQKEYPDVPYFLLGHSMGSFLARQYICVYGQGLSGAVIMGTGYQPKALTVTGMALTKVMAALKGWRYRSRLIDSMAFGSYNKKFEPARTDKDWLSRNEENVDAYKKEKRCSFMFTLNGYYNLFLSLYKLSCRDYVARMPQELPVFFVSGEDDPVGGFGNGVKKVYAQFEKLGMKNMSIKLYPDDRHEILNELDRDIVYEDITKWITNCNCPAD